MKITKRGRVVLLAGFVTAAMISCSGEEGTHNFNNNANAGISNNNVNNNNDNDTNTNNFNNYNNNRSNNNNNNNINNNRNNNNNNNNNINNNNRNNNNNNKTKSAGIVKGTLTDEVPSKADMAAAICDLISENINQHCADVEKEPWQERALGHDGCVENERFKEMSLKALDKLIGNIVSTQDCTDLESIVGGLLQ